MKAGKLAKIPPGPPKVSVSETVSHGAAFNSVERAWVAGAWPLLLTRRAACGTDGETVGDTGVAAPDLVAKPSRFEGGPQNFDRDTQ